MFKGSITALVTPFRDGAVDFAALENLVNWQISEGAQGLVPCGTTGESPTLPIDEHLKVIETVVQVAAGRVPVIAGTGSNSTASAIATTIAAAELGADGALVVCPYYNKPTQEGLYAHFRALHDATSLPILIYNIPGRTAADMGVGTMAQLNHDCERIIGVKDATGDLARVSLQRAAMGPDFIQLSGEDMTAMAFNAAGGHGCISVSANVAPKLCAALQDACALGDYTAALALQDRLAPLHNAMFIETSPSPVKFALSLLEVCTAEVRLPLVGVGEESAAVIAGALASVGMGPVAPEFMAAPPAPRDGAASLLDEITKG